MPLQHFVKTSKNGKYHIKWNGWSICYHMFSSSYPDWSSSMLAYYGRGASSAFYASAVASPTSHPYLWGGQHPLMPPYGTPAPYPPGGVYAHPSMATEDYFYDLPYNIEYQISVLRLRKTMDEIMKCTLSIYVDIYFD